MPEREIRFGFITGYGAEYSLLFIIFAGSLTFFILAGNPNDEDTTTRYQRNGSLAHCRTGVAGFDRRSTCSRTYDAKSYESVLWGTYPSDEDIKIEMDAVLDVLVRHGIEVLRPEPIANYNQIFARDVAFAIDDKLFVSNLIADRARESEAFSPIWDCVGESHLVRLSEDIHAEGGDILLYDDILFIGTYLQKDYPSFKTARTNARAVDFFREFFPHKTIIPIELIKHDTDPMRSVLHLDCAFQPVGRGRAIVYRQGFLHSESFGLITEIFGGRDNLFEITPEEAYMMNTNIFSISPDTVISERNFVRLNNHLREAWGMTVEEVPYAEISKQGGLLRCSTMPLVRE